MSYKIEIKKTLKLATPVVIAQAGQNITNIIDTMMVGHYNTISLSASGLANNVFVIFLVFGLGFTYGLTPMVGKLYGENKTKRLGIYLRHSLLLNIIFSFFLFGVILFIGSHLNFIGKNDEVNKIASPYLTLNAFSLFPLILFFTAKQFAEGLQFTKIAMIYTLIANMINLIVNFLLIYGKFGFPELGLFGAGIGTLISRIVMALGLWHYILTKKHFRTYILGWNKPKFDKNLISKHIKISLPISLHYLMEVGAFGVGAIFVGLVGFKELAAHQIVLGLISFTFMMLSGVASATTIRVSHAYGKGNKKLVSTISKSSLIVAIIFMCFTAIIFSLSGKQLALLHTSDLDVVAITIGMFYLAALFQIVDGIQVVAAGALRGISDVNKPALIAFFSYWVVSLPIGYYLSQHTYLKELGVWVGFVVGLGLAALLLGGRLFKMLKS